MLDSSCQWIQMITTTTTANFSNQMDCNGHPLLVLGMASQSLAENVIDLDDMNDSSTMNMNMNDENII